MMELKRLFEDYREAREKANKADDAWEKDPCSEELENASDLAYNKEFDLFQKLQNEIVTITGGKISKGTASAMINGRFEDLEKIIERIA